MSDIHIMQILQSLDQLPGNPLDFGLWQSLMLVLVREEVSPGHEFEDHVASLEVALLDQVKDTIDIGMGHLLQQLDLVVVTDIIRLVLELDRLACHLEPRCLAMGC